MRIFSLALIAALCVTNSVSAIAPLNMQSIKQAQLYGTSQAKSDLSYFLKPWLSYEEKADQLNETAETAYLYTPFLLIATDAREKKLHQQAVAIEDSEKVITNYLDTMSFSVKLFGGNENFSKGTTAFIQQGDRVIKAWSSAAPDTAEPSPWRGKDQFTAQCYFYFDEREMDLTKPITLVVTSGDRKQHNFYFELDKVK